MDKEVYSYSRLSSYDACPYSYYATYRLDERDEDSQWGALGSHAHDTIELVLKKEMDSSFAADYFYSNMPELHFPNMKEGYKERLIGDCLGFFENLPILQSELQFNNVIGIEREFIVDIDGEKLRGFIDAEFKLEDGILNRDWKTSSMSGFSGKELKKKARQLYLYSKSTKEHFGEFPKYLEFYMIKYKKPIRIEFNEKDYQEAIDWALRTIEAINNDKIWEKVESYFKCKNLCSSTSCPLSGNYKTK